MQNTTRAVLTMGLFACLIMSAVQAMAHKPKGSTCEIVNGACVSVDCSGECGAVFPQTCACIR